MGAETYRRRAQDCMKLAQSCPQRDVREALQDLATDFMREAEELADRLPNKRDASSA